MNIKKLLVPLCSAGVLAHATAFAQDAPSREGATSVPLPDLADAKVTIPYTELKALWDAARLQFRPIETESAPPVRSVILSAEYELALGGNSARLDARYRIRSLTAEWNLVPLLGGDARLEQAGTESSGLLWRDGGYHLLTKEVGESEVQLQFALSDPATWLAGLRLTPGSAALNRLHLTGIPDGKAVRIDGLAPTSSGDGEVTYHIPGSAEELVIFLEPRREPEVVVPPAPPQPSTWILQSEVFVHFQEGRLYYESQIHCQANEGSGLEMDLYVPANALDLTLTGDDLANSELARRENGTRRFRVRWQTADILDRVLQLSYAIPQSPLATSWTLSAPYLLQEGATRSLFAIKAVEGLELTGENLKSSVQSRRLPEWLRQRIGTAEFLTAESAADCELRTIWLPRLETAQAMVQSASYESRLVADGALLVKATYILTHQAPLAWRIELPEMEEILTCEVNDRSAQPVKRGGNEIEFALGAPGATGSTVSLCYAARLETLDRVSGRCDLKLPRTDLFIHELTWALTLPEDYKTTAIEGNLTIDRHPPDPGAHPSSESILRLRKQLVRGEHPALELYYQRRGLDD